MHDEDPFASHLTYRPEPAEPVRGPRPRGVLVAGVLAVLVLAGVAAAAAWPVLAGDEPAAPVPAASSPVAAVAAMVDDVDYYVGTNVAAGVYRQATETPACDWQTSDPVTGERIERGIPGSGIATVNLGPEVKFRSSGCGAWVLVS